MARSIRLEMRVTPQMMARIDRARGEINRTTWCEGAFRMRLAAGSTPPPPLAPEPEDAPAQPAPRPPKRAKPRSAPAPEPEFDPEPDWGEESVEPEEQLPLEEQELPPEPEYAQRPPPRHSGGRKKR